MPRSHSIVLTALVTGVLAIPAAASATTTDDAVADTLAWLGASAEDATAVAAEALVDGTGDTFRYAIPGSTPATNTEPYTDILRFTGAPVWFESGFGPDDLPAVPCGTTTEDGALVVCAGTPDLTAGHWGFVVEFAGAIPTEDSDLFQSLAVPLLSADGQPWEPQGDFLWDTFQGTDLWYEVTRSPGTPFQLGVTDAADFSSVSSGAIAVIRGATLTMLVPGEDLGIPVPPLEDVAALARDGDDLLGAATGPGRRACGGAHSHVHKGGFGADASEESGVDSAPDTNSDTRRGPGSLHCAGQRPIRLGPPVLALPEPEPTEEDTTEEEPQEEPVDETDDPPLVTPEPVAEGGMSPLVIIVVILVLLGAGVFVGGTRQRKKKGGGTTTRGGDDEDDDEEEPRDVGGGGAHSSTEEDPPKYAYDVRLVLGGDVVDLADNQSELLARVPEGAKDEQVIGTYFVGFLTKVEESKHTQTKTDKFQIRAPGGPGYDAEAALVDDPKADLWTDNWWRKETKRRGYVSEGGDSLYASARTNATRTGWNERDPYTSGLGQSAKYPKLPVQPRKRDVTSSAVLRTLTRVTVQFRPEGEAKGRTDHLYSGRGESYLTLKAETSCAWCADSTRVGKAVCDFAAQAEAAGGFDVEAEHLVGGSTFKYSNESNEVKLSQQAKAAEGTVTVAGPKAGVSVGGVSIAEVQVGIKPAEGHGVEKKSPKMPGRDRFDHAESLRCTLRAASSVTSDATVKQLPSWKAGVESTAFIAHDLSVHGTVASSWPFPVKPKVDVFLDEQEGAGHGRVVVGGKTFPVHSPESERKGAYWWTRGPQAAD